MLAPLRRKEGFVLKHHSDKQSELPTTTKKFYPARFCFALFYKSPHSDITTEFQDRRNKFPLLG